MDRKDVINIARRFKEAVCEKYKPTAVYLYGSYSKGTQREDSDIDLAVIVPQMKGDWFANIPGLWKISRSINVLIEPVLIEECHPSPLYEEILRSGILIS